MINLNYMAIQLTSTVKEKHLYITKCRIKEVSSYHAQQSSHSLPPQAAVSQLVLNQYQNVTMHLHACVDQILSFLLQCFSFSRGMSTNIKPAVFKQKLAHNFLLTW